MSSMKSRTKVFLPVMALMSANSYAIDWLFEPSIQITERYTDNLRLQVNAPQDEFVTKISPNLLLGYQAENQDLKSTFTWNELIYANESSFDFSEKIGDIQHRYAGEDFKTDISGRYAEQSSINTQLDIEGSGNIQLLVPRTTRSISPSITYNLTENNALQLSFSYVDVAFDRTASLSSNLGYSDYDNQQYSAAFIHTFSERLSANLSIAYSEFNSANNTTSAPTVVFGIPATISTNYKQRSKTFLYQAGLQYMFNEKTTVGLSVGVRDSENDTEYVQSALPVISFIPPLTIQDLSRSSNNFGHVFSANLTRKEEWGEVRLDAGQQLNPSSSGSQRESTTFSIKGHYKLSDRLTTGLNANYLNSKSITNFTGGSTQFDRTYTNVSPHIRWRWTPQVSLELSYSYRQQDYDSRGVTATSNGVQLQFSFQPEINRKVK